MYFTIKEKPGHEPPTNITRNTEVRRIIPTNTYLMRISKCQSVAKRKRQSGEGTGTTKPRKMLLSSRTHSHRVRQTWRSCQTTMAQDQPRHLPHEGRCHRPLPVALLAIQICGRRGRSSSKTQQGPSSVYIHGGLCL